MDHNHEHPLVYLSKSYSAPEVNPYNRTIRRKLILQEVLQDLNTNTTLVRTISTERVYGLTSLTSGGKAVEDVTIGASFQETPMEIDSSNDFSHRTLKTELTQNALQETTSIVVPLRKPVPSKCLVASLALMVLLSLAGVYTILFKDRFLYVNRNLRLDNIKTDLERNVLQQTAAIQAVIDSLSELKDWRAQIKVLPFVGSTGVGKTFVANIVKKHFFPSLVHEIGALHLNEDKRRRDVVRSLNACCCNLIIVDDLRAGDARNVVGFLKQLPSSQLALVIPIFNIQDVAESFPSCEINEDDLKTIRYEFEESGFYYRLVYFEEIDERTVEKWLRKQTDDDRIIRSLLSDDHVKYHGFKGLEAKLRVTN